MSLQNTKSNLKMMKYARDNGLIWSNKIHKDTNKLARQVENVFPFLYQKKKIDKEKSVILYIILFTIKN